jgi:hypothetical protein
MSLRVKITPSSGASGLSCFSFFQRMTLKKSLDIIQKVTDCVNNSGWSIREDYSESIKKLLTLLHSLESEQTELNLVDSHVPWNEKSNRLLSWLRSSPSFSCIPIDLVNNLSLNEGSRGVMLKQAISKEQEVFKVPADAFLSTETAALTKDFGQIYNDDSYGLEQTPTIALALHLMIEHAKCLVVPFISDSSPQLEDRNELMKLGVFQKPKTESHGHGHEGKSHGHSHGGKACHGHGGPEEPSKSIQKIPLDYKSHVWGSRFRAYLSSKLILIDVIVYSTFFISCLPFFSPSST